MSTTLEAAIRTRLVSERLAGKQPVLSLDEVAYLGGEVEDGHIESFGKVVSALIDEFGADVIPDDKPRGRSSPEDMAEDLERFAQRRADVGNDQRLGRILTNYEDTHREAAERLAVQTGGTLNSALASIVRGRAFDLREAGKYAESSDAFAVVRLLEARDRPAKSVAQKVEAAMGEPGQG
jgi:hypothetical protein